MKKLLGIYSDKQEVEYARLKEAINDKCNEKEIKKHEKSFYSKCFSVFWIIFVILIYLSISVYVFLKLFSYEINSKGEYNWKISFTLKWLQTVILNNRNYNIFINYVLACTIINSFFYFIRAYRNSKALGFLLYLFSLVFFLVLFTGTLPQFTNTVGVEVKNFDLYKYGGSGIEHWNKISSGFHMHNGYGLFRRMTGVGFRPEFVIQYQPQNQSNWIDYEFRDKVGDLKKMPRVSMPHQARLEWQLWFVSLDPNRQEVFLYNLMYKLFHNDKLVLKYIGLFDEKLRIPKISKPERIRFVMYKYYLNDWESYKDTKNFWRRSIDTSFRPQEFTKQQLPNIKSSLERTGLNVEDGLGQETKYFNNFKTYNYIWQALSSIFLCKFVGGFF